MQSNAKKDSAPKRSMELFQIMDRMRKAWSEITPNGTLNKSHFSTLLILRFGKCPTSRDLSLDRDPFLPMTLSEIAQQMHQSMPAVSQRITKLEAMEYVVREADPSDKRTIWISLTPQGLELVEEARRDMDRKMDAIMNRLQEEEITMLFGLLNKLADSVELQKKLDEDRS